MSGDLPWVACDDGGCTAAMIDVLGHGPEAHAVTHVAREVLERHPGAAPRALLDRLHEGLRGTRGAAAGLCRLDADGSLSFVGIGNTTLRCFGSQQARLVSRDGVVGQGLRTPRVERLSLLPGDTVVMASDGVRDRYELPDYPGLVLDPPRDVARRLVERFGRGHDDAAVLVLRCSS